MGEPSPCHVIERDAWHLFPLKNQKDGSNRDSPIRAERTASSRTQPQMNEPELGDSVPMASARQRRCLPLPARSGVIRQAVEEAPAEAGPGEGPLPVPLSRHLLGTSRLGFRATQILVIGQMPITATAIGVLAANCTLDCPIAEARG